MKLKEELELKAKRIYKLEKQNENKGGAIFLLVILFISSWMIIPTIGGNVNEDEYCLKKLNTYFPEYDFYKADYNDDIGTVGGNDAHDYSCKGFYYIEIDENLIVRDGLKEISETKTTETKYFKLIDQRDIDYMRSDDLSNSFFVLGLVVLILGIWIYPGAYLGVYF